MRKMLIPARTYSLFALCALVLFPAGGAAAEEFIYKQKTGDKYRILSTVREDVYNDYKLSHSAEILNRVSVEVTGESESSASHRVVFQTSERALAKGAAESEATSERSFHWSREYVSEFERDRLGYLTIDSKYFMPVVRNVPVFPGRDLTPGEKWSAEGHEMHDFRDTFGIKEPYNIPFIAYYEFLGERHWKGKTWPAFSVSYHILTSPPAVPGRVWPKSIIGSSDQIVYWDSAQGQPAGYEEEFRMVFAFSNNRTVEYRGRAESEVIWLVEINKEQIADEIAEDLNRLKIPDATVRVVEEGITISLEDIRFRADTAIMLPGEMEKLDKIAAILKRYPERDILIGGHSAMAGTTEGQMRLSIERASVVADYLVAQQALKTDQVVVRGYGAERPVADNRTEDGRRKNRRVEFTILEN
jgi:outer membrane protein OmpA-like peptidoglycan-associated protein